MANDKDNKKLPKSAVDEGDIEPKYGYIHGEWDALGGHHFKYRYPEENEKSYSEELLPSGSYNTTQHDSDKKEIHTNLKSGEFRGYTAGGHASQVDGHYDHNGEKTGRVEHAKDFGQATGGNLYRGTQKQEIKMSGGAQYRATQQASDSTVCETKSGTYRDRCKKDRFKATEGNYVSMGEKNKVEVFKQDVSMYAGANHDVHIKEKGKIETGSTMLLQTGSDATVNSAAKMIIKSGQNTEVTSQAEIKITADTKITIKVGSNSIEISSSGIIINANGGKLDLKASGDITTLGSTTKLQGGGQNGIPTTIP